jgi:hypothetical protein
MHHLHHQCDNQPIILNICCILTSGFGENEEINNLKLQLEDTQNKISALVYFTNKQRLGAKPTKPEGVDKDFFDNMDSVSFQLMSALQTKEVILLKKLGKLTAVPQAALHSGRFSNRKLIFTDDAKAKAEFSAQPNMKSTENSNAIDWYPCSIADLDIPNDLDSLKEGSTINVGLAYSGLTTKVGPQELYLRKACVDLWNFLSRIDKTVYIVSGCPGVGKSVEVFTYSMWHAKYRQQRVLYIHGKDSDGFFFILKSKKETDEILTGHVADFSTETKFIADIIRSILGRDEVDLIVLDGQLNELIRKVFFLVKDHRTVKLITCTSFQALELFFFDRIVIEDRRMIEVTEKREKKRSREK